MTKITADIEFVYLWTSFEEEFNIKHFIARIYYRDYKFDYTGSDPRGVVTCDYFLRH